MVGRPTQQSLPHGEEESIAENEPAGRNTARKKANGYEPPKLGKAIRLPVPDFNDPQRPPVCLGVDFPIAPINYNDHYLQPIDFISGSVQQSICRSTEESSKVFLKFRKIGIESPISAAVHGVDPLRDLSDGSNGTPEKRLQILFLFS